MYRTIHNARMMLLLIFISLLLNDKCYSQNDFTAIEYDHISQKGMRRFIRQFQSDSTQRLSDLQASVNPNTSLGDFRKFKKTYLLKSDANEVWYHYSNALQTEIWDISKITFGMIYSRDNHAMIYADDEFYGLEEGNIYFINLKVLRGIFNIPVAFEITMVDPDKKIIEFSYLAGGEARGLQRIGFTETAEGYTRLIHESYVKSESSFRDKYLYPYFHNKLLNEFHSNMAKVIDSSPLRESDQVVEAK